MIQGFFLFLAGETKIKSMLAFIFWTCYIGLPAKKRLVEESTKEAAFQEKKQRFKKSTCNRV